MKSIKIVSYLRVSTSGQGDSGLGLEAQRQYIQQAALQNGWTIIGEFIDTVSGSIAIEDRPEGAKAIQMCKASSAQLCAAKLDRISRSVAHISALMERVEFKVATMPSADAFQLHIYAALAEQERKFIGQRTREALASLKARAESGDVVSIQKIANRTQALTHGRTQANRAKAAKAVADRVSAFDTAISAEIEACLYRGLRTLVRVAECLNKKGVTTAKGGEWSATQVSRVMSRLGLTFEVANI
ncbi:recombinase family protein [Pseudomonas sp. R45(2017)]|uniref:recombinase family protein n=1 Tax=Pseudomonas sp. R45(2017) TaxID=1981678 RepID=UPI003530AECD